MKNYIRRQAAFVRMLLYVIPAVFFVCCMMQGAADVWAEEEESVHTDKQGMAYTLNENGTCLVSALDQKAVSAVIPGRVKVSGSVYRVTGIGPSAFRGCSALKKIEVPNSIRSIQKDVFDGCRKLSAVHITADDAVQKKSGGKVSLTVKVSAAWFSTDADVSLSVGRDVVRKAAALKKKDMVLMTAVTKNPHYSVKDAQFQSILLEGAAVKAIAKSGCDFKAGVRQTGGSSYFVKVNAADLKQLSAGLQLALCEKDVRDTDKTFRSDLNKALKKNGIGSSRIRLLGYSFSQDSKTNIDVVFPADGIRGIKAGGQAYIYRYDKKKRKFAALSFHAFTVSKQGSLTMSIARGGSFIVTGRKLKDMCSYPASEFLREGGNTYYVDAAGAAVSGWRKIGGEYYYFDRENGKMASGRSVDGVRLLKNGTAKQTAASVQKIQTMMKARAVVNQITNPADSKSVKIEKCFRWIFQFPYKRYRRLQPIYRQPGWEVTFANDIFDRHQGCCVSEAAAAAFLFHECGYETVYVACDTGHAWVELNGRVYDPLFAEARGFSRYYNVSYSSYGLHAVLKRKI